MRGRSSDLLEHFSTIGYPTLHFLAPRAFARWPSHIQTSYPRHIVPAAYNISPSRTITSTPKDRFEQCEYRTRSPPFLWASRRTKVGAASKHRHLNTSSKCTKEKPNFDNDCSPAQLKDRSRARSSRFDRSGTDRMQELSSLAQIFESLGVDKDSYPLSESTKNFASAGAGLAFTKFHRRLNKAVSSDARKRGGKRDKSSLEGRIATDSRSLSKALQEYQHRAKSEPVTEAKFVTHESDPQSIGQVELATQNEHPPRCQEPELQHIMLDSAEEWHHHMKAIGKDYDLNFSQCPRDYRNNKHTNIQETSEPSIEEELIQGELRTYGAYPMDETEVQWLRDAQKIQLDRWCRSILYILRFRPQDTLTYLLKTPSNLLPPSDMIMDCLDMLTVIACTKSNRSYRQSIQQKLLAVLRVLHGRYGKMNVFVSQRTVEFLIRQSSPADILSLYRTLWQMSVPINPRNLLAFAYESGRNSFPNMASEFVLKAVSSGYEVYSSTFRTACVSILRSAKSSRDAFQSSLKLMELFQRLGVRVDTEFYNIHLENLIASYRPQEHQARTIYSFLIDGDPPADGNTFAILLRACRKFDWHNFQQTLKDDIHMRILERTLDTTNTKCKEELLASEIASVKRKSQQVPNEGFESVLQLYMQFWSGKPLEDLGILLNSHQQQTDKPQPSTFALWLMVSFYLKTASIEERQGTFQKFLRARWSETASPITSLASTEHMWNTFLGHALSLETSNPSIEGQKIMDLMVARHDMPDVDQKAANTPGSCQPTATTWTCLYCGVLQHGYLDEAQKIMDRMRSHGCLPSLRMWNALVQYHAIKQDDRVITALKSAVGEGHRLDARTAKALIPLKDTAMLARCLNEIRQAIPKRQWNKQIVWRNLVERMTRYRLVGHLRLDTTRSPGISRKLYPGRKWRRAMDRKGLDTRISEKQIGPSTTAAIST